MPELVDRAFEELPSSFHDLAIKERLGQISAQLESCQLSGFELRIIPMDRKIDFQILLHNFLDLSTSDFRSITKSLDQEMLHEYIDLARTLTSNDLILEFDMAKNGLFKPSFFLPLIGQTITSVQASLSQHSDRSCLSTARQPKRYQGLILALDQMASFDPALKISFLGYMYRRDVLPIFRINILCKDIHQAELLGSYLGIRNQHLWKICSLCPTLVLAIDSTDNAELRLSGIELEVNNISNIEERLNYLHSLFDVFPLVSDVPFSIEISRIKTWMDGIILGHRQSLFLKPSQRISHAKILLKGEDPIGLKLYTAIGELR